MSILDLTQQEVSESKQDVVTPFREIHQQTLQGILGYEPKLVIHVDSQSDEQDKGKNEKRYYNKNRAYLPPECSSLQLSLPLWAWFSVAWFH